MKIPNSNNKEKITAALYTLLISGFVFAGVYFFKIQRNVPENIKAFVEKPTVDSAKINAEKTVDSLYSSTEIYLPPVISTETSEEKVSEKPEQETKVAEKPKTEEKKTKEVAKTEADKKTTETKKTATKDKTTEKTDKAKNFVTVSYVIDKKGNFTTAQRIDGLRDKTSINKAIAYVKKNIKGKKGKETKGTYTYKF
jgi:cell division septation protein DedD